MSTVRPQGALADAIRLHRAGQLERAAGLYREAIKQAPEVAEAWHLLGVLSNDLGRAEEALDCLSKAAGLDADNPAVLYNLANTLKDQGRHDEAVDHYQQALSRWPKFAEALLNLGATLLAQRRFDEARTCFDRLLALSPDSPEAHFNLALVHRKLGLWQKAQVCFERVLAVSPDHVAAQFELANLALEAGQIDEALQHYERTLDLDPNHAGAHTNLGHLWHLRGDVTKALAECQRALEIDHEFADAHFNLGVILQTVPKHSEAAAHLRRAVELRPAWAEAHYRLGHALRFSGEADDSQAAFERALQLKPDNLLWKVRVATAGKPLFADNSDIEQFRNHLAEQLDRFRRDPSPVNTTEIPASSCRPPFCLPYHGRDDRMLKEQFAAVFRGRLGVSAPRQNTGKPHVGFVVTEGHHGVFARCMAGIIGRLPSRDLRVTLVAPRSVEQKLRRAIANPEVEFLTLPETLEDAALAIGEAALDFLYHWEVGTDSTNYFLPLLRTAPRQCTSWGWPVTSGMTEIDYFLSSTNLETPASDAHYTERLIRFDRLPTYYYRPNLPGQGKTRADYGVSEHAHLYFCPHNVHKFHPDFDALIGELLRTDADAVVVWIEARNRPLTEALWQRFHRTLSDVVDRIRAVPRMTQADFLGLLAASDAVLDVPHYGAGANTMYEAMAVGTPVITWPGKFHRGRYALASYRQMGMLDCVAETAEEYCHTAIRLASDAEFRSSVRESILERNDELFEDRKAVAELQTFLSTAIGCPADDTQP